MPPRTTIMRFMILGDNRGSAAFNQFTRSVDAANRAVDKHRVSLDKAKASEQSFGASLGVLASGVLGFSDAQNLASKRSNLFAKGLAAASLASGPLEATVASLTTVVAGVAAATASAGIGLAAYGLAAKQAIAPVIAAVQAQGKVQQAQTTAQATYTAATRAAQVRLAASLSTATTAAQRTSAQNQYLTATHSALAARTRATTLATQQYRQQLAGLTPAQRQLATGLVTARQTYQSWAAQFTRPILMPFIRMLSVAGPLLHALDPAVRQAAAAIEILSNQFISAAQGGGFARWIRSITPAIAPTLIGIGHVIGNVIVGLAGIVRAFAPVGVTIVGWLDRITAKFADWGRTLGSHSGFQQLVASFHRDGPVLAGIAKNLITVLGNIARAWATMITPGNSRLLLLSIQPLAQLLALLSRNRQLVQALTYLYLIHSAAGQLGPVFKGARAGVKVFTDTLTGLRSGSADVKGFAGWLGRLRDGFRSSDAAGSAFSGLAGTLGGKLRVVVDALRGAAVAAVAWSRAQLAAAFTGVRTAVLAGVTAIRSWAIWSRIAAVATRAWAAIQAAFNVVMDANPIVLVIIAVAALVAGVIYAYHRFAWFRDFVNTVGRFIARNWQILLGVLTAGTGTAVLYIVRHWAQIQAFFAPVVGFIRRNWRLLLAVMTGGVSEAVIFIIQHWRMIWDAAARVIGQIRAGWNAVMRFLQGLWRGFVNFFLGIVATILHGAVTAFGWIPGLGGKLRAASTAFDRFRDRVNSSLRGINGRTVAVNVNFAGGVKGAFGGSPTGPGRNFARGGPVRGPGGPDDDRAGLYALSNDEYVVRARAHRRYGTRLLDAINEGRLPADSGRIAGYRAAGGPVGLRVQPGLPSQQEITAGVRRPVIRLAVQWAKQLMGGIWNPAVGNAIVQYALQFLGRRYVWGGTTPAGWDCSGFTGYVYRHFGFNPPRTSQQQQLWARRSGDVPGALVFFYGVNGGATHVGLSMGRGRMINAEDPAMGTRIAGTGGNTGFGVPPHGLGRFGGGFFPGGRGTTQELGRAMAAQLYGWRGVQWFDLDALWNQESGWNPLARNPSSGAYGIPQALPAGKMASAGADWRTNPATQIRWGLNYIRQRYGDPVGAESHEMRYNWYDRGGWLPTGVSLAVNNTGRAERVVPPGEHAGVTVNVGPVTVRESADVDLLARRLAFGISAAGFP